MKKLQTKTPIYNPGLSYQWDPAEEFTLTGREFEYLFRSTAEYLAQPESQNVLRAFEVHRILEQKIKDGVERGIIKAKE